MASSKRKSSKKKEKKSVEDVSFELSTFVPYTIYSVVNAKGDQEYKFALDDKYVVVKIMNTEEEFNAFYEFILKYKNAHKKRLILIQNQINEIEENFKSNLLSMHL
jgi:hypothetical protein